MSTSERMTVENISTSPALARRLDALLAQYKPTQFAAVYDDEAQEWVLSYPKGTSQETAAAGAVSNG